MAHFCKLGVGNIVEQVVVVSNDVATTEQAGVEFLQNLYGDRSVWKQTSYNTFAGKYWTTNDSGEKVEAEDQSKAFRKNYAGMGHKYDASRDAFILPQPFDSWTLNEETCLWQPPIEKPELTVEQRTNNNYYRWNEDTRTWDLI